MAVQAKAIIAGTTTSIPITLISDRTGAGVNFSGGTLTAVCSPTSGSSFTVVGSQVSSGVGVVTVSAGNLSGIGLLSITDPYRLHGKATFTTSASEVFVRDFNVGVLPDDGEWVYGLTTLAAAREFLGFSDNSEDYDIAQVIRSESQRIRRLCGRNPDNGFESMERTERYEWPLSGRQYPNEWPVTAISSIREYYGPGANDYTTVPTAIYEADTDQRAVVFWDNPRQNFLAGLPTETFRTQNPVSRTRVNHIQAVYTGGYSTVPPSLEDICLQAVAQKWVNKGRDYGLQSETLGQYTYTRRPETDVDAWLTDQLADAGWINGGALV
ncbi:MAG: hypothetical protein B7733_13075 [Myxococcales bacterium FL481]|nr:MAG: hypothetical protein B7733_13075 [Myxococcales bacterium FL481]